MKPEYDKAAMFQLETIAALAGSALHEKDGVKIVHSLIQAIYLPALALTLISREQDQENPLMGEMPDNPGQILRDLAEVIEGQATEERMEMMIDAYRKLEGIYQSEEAGKKMPENLTVDDILGEKNGD